MENNNSVLLEMKNICKSFPGVKALDNVSLTVKRRHGACTGWGKTGRASPP